MPNSFQAQPESSVPTPLSVVLGLVATGADQVRALPGRALRLPVRIPLMTVSAALTASEAVRREYDDLAVRGEALLGRLRGHATDSGDAVVDGANSVADVGRSIVDTARTEARHGLETVSDAAAGAVQGTAAGPGPLPMAQPAAGPPPVLAASDAPSSPIDEPSSPIDAPSPAIGAADAAVAPQVRETVADVVARLGDANADGVPDGAVLGRAELPLPDYDHLTLGSLRGRLRTFDLRDLVLLRDYEKAHANRISVVTMFDNRIAKLAAEA